MKRLQHLALAGLLSAAALTTACDRERTPGQDPQNVNDFSTAPPARTIETDMDSVNNQQNVQPPTGEGSAPDQMQSAENGQNAAPGGSNATATQNASGQTSSVDKSATNGSSSTTAPASTTTGSTTTGSTTQNQ